MMKLANNLRLEKLRVLISKSKEPVPLIQSLLYGCGGLLFDIRLREQYIENLKHLWEVNKSELKVRQINKSEWQFFRLRPQNFPTLRIAYGSQLILKLISENLFKNIILEFKTANFDVKECHKNLLKMY
jgi:hypothetical protein